MFALLWTLWSTFTGLVFLLEQSKSESIFISVELQHIDRQILVFLYNIHRCYNNRLQPSFKKQKDDNEVLQESIPNLKQLLKALVEQILLFSPWSCALF